MTIVLIDPGRPVFPGEFLDATLVRGEPASIDEGFSIDVAAWGIHLANDATWFLTERVGVALRRQAAGETLIDARLHLVEAIEVMDRALSLGSWERAQSHESLIPYLREESEEFIDAVLAGNDVQILQELGDVLLQVLFHSAIAARRGAFDVNDVAASFVNKLRSRSPYLFDGSAEVVEVAEQERLWLLGKAREKARRQVAE